MKKLKIWNGRGHGKYQNSSMYVAAYSIKQALELLNTVCFGPNIDVLKYAEIKNYYSADCWGNTMEGIEPIEPCVYTSKGYGKDKPIRLI